MDRQKLLQRVREEHAALRKHLDVLDELARQLRSDERRLIGGLRGELESFDEEFRDLLVWEERDIAPLLAPEDVSCRTQLLADALELSRVLGEFEAQDLPPQMLARHLADLSRRVRRDVAREEKCLLRRAGTGQIGAPSNAQT